jgi:hypothetical protein
MNSEQATRTALLELIPPPEIDLHWDDVLRRSQRGRARRRRGLALALVAAAAAVPTLAVAGLHLVRSPRTEVSGHGSSSALGLAADFSATRRREFRPVGPPGSGRRFGGVRWQLRIDAKTPATVTATLRIRTRRSDLSLPLCGPCRSENHGLSSRPGLWLAMLDLPTRPPVEVRLKTARGVLHFTVQR